MTERHISTRNRILAIAGRLFAERGFDGTSVRDITGEAKVNLGAVTYHFGTKLALFSEVVKKKIEPLIRIGKDVYESNRSPEDKLRGMLEIYAMYVLHQEPDLRVFFAEILAGGDRLPAASTEGVEWRNRVFSEIMEDGVRQGAFRKCDAEVLAWSFFGMLSAYILYEPLTSRGRRRGSFSSAYVQRIVSAALGVFMNGLLVRPREER